MVKSNKGISIIESLVCIVIIGIGFISIMQLSAFSVNSMDRATEKNKLNPMILVHGLFKKINPISISYTENLNRSANQVIGDVPIGYKFGWIPEHGLNQSEEVGSNLGSWDHKRDGSIRSGFKLTRSINISTNFSSILIK